MAMNVDLEDPPLSPRDVWVPRNWLPNGTHRSRLPGQNSPILASPPKISQTSKVCFPFADMPMNGAQHLNQRGERRHGERPHFQPLSQDLATRHDLKQPTTEEEIREYMERRRKRWLNRYGLQISAGYVFGLPLLEALLSRTRYHRLSDALLVLWVSIWVSIGAVAHVFLKLEERARLRRQKEYMQNHNQR
jgi:hypothetical protein